jgi:hypothetical protein
MVSWFIGYGVDGVRLWVVHCANRRRPSAAAHCHSLQRWEATPRLTPWIQVQWKSITKPVLVIVWSFICFGWYPFVCWHPTEPPRRVPKWTSVYRCLNIAKTWTESMYISSLILKKSRTTNIQQKFRRTILLYLTFFSRLPREHLLHPAGNKICNGCIAEWMIVHRMRLWEGVFPHHMYLDEGCVRATFGRKPARKF